MPVFAASQKAGNSRSDLAVSKNARSCKGFQARTSLRGRRRFGGLSIGYDVPNDKSLTASILEGLAQDDVNLEHGLSVEATLAVDAPIGQEFGIELVDVLDPEPTERDAPDARHDVTLDVPSVAVLAAGPKADLLSRQPSLQEVPGHRKPQWTVLRPCRQRK